MPCCGKKRQQLRQTARAQRPAKPAETTTSQPPPEHDPLPHFRYMGKTGLTVIGPRTGKRYRFDHPGAVVAIDPQDGRALASVSVLRRVGKPTKAVRPG
jgi:hypothetical protein